MWAVQDRLGRGFRLSFDHFGRSSSPQNHALTQHFAGRLAEAGLIEEVVEKQVYSVAERAAFCPTATSRAPAPKLRL